jgi:hypothetical protein
MMADQPPAPEYRDRSLGLLLFGIAEIAIGLALAVLVPVALVLVSSIEPGAGASATVSMVVVYLLVGAVFVVLGFGSIFARRWARELWLSVGWIWLLTGVLSVVASWLLMPALLRTAGAGALSAGTQWLIVAVTSAFLLVIYVLLPAAILLFYRSPHVEATCAQRGPAEQWTDNLAPRLLTLAVLWALVASSAAVMPAYGWVFPFFGRVLAGTSGAVLWLMVAGLSLVLAVGAARGRYAAWWGSIVLTLASMVTTVWTFAGVDLGAFFDAMRLAPEQGQLFQGLAGIGRAPAVVFWLVVWISFLVYLIGLRRFFQLQDPTDHG